MPFRFNPFTGKLDWTDDLSGYFLLDQTTPQSVINGAPNFNGGLNLPINAYIGFGANPTNDFLGWSDSINGIKLTTATGQLNLSADSEVHSIILSNGDGITFNTDEGFSFYGGKVGIGTEALLNYVGFPPTSLVAGTAHVGVEESSLGTGGNLILQGGRALTGGTNLNAGDVYITSGVSTGSGSANIYLQTATAGVSGTTDRDPTTKVTIAGNGDVTLNTGALNINANSKQIVFDADSATTLTLTAAPSLSSKTVTIPNTTGTLYISSGTDVTVADGGTGRSSHTAYSLLAGGTTTTGIQQSIANPSTTGNVLRSQGTSVLPAWSTLTIPNTGTAYKLPVFTNTNVMGELANVGATNQILIGTTGDIPSWSNNLPLAGKMTIYNGVATEGYGVPALVDDVALTGQTAIINSTNFTNASTAGLYRLNYYLLDTSADITAGTIQLSVAFTDNAGATTVTSSALPLTALGRTSGIFYIQLASGSVAYSTVLTGIFGTAQYALYMSLERLN
jgi:hypothetical protein